MPSWGKTAASMFILCHGKVGGIQRLSVASLNLVGRSSKLSFVLTKPDAPCRRDGKLDNLGVDVLGEEQVPQKIHEIPVIDPSFIKRHIIEGPNFFSEVAVLEQVPSRLRSEVACFTRGDIQDMSVKEVRFCREDIFARSPGEKIYFVWMWRFQTCL